MGLGSNSVVHVPTQKAHRLHTENINGNIITHSEFLTVTLLRYFKIPQQWVKRHDSGTAYQLQACFACPTYATSHAITCLEKDEILTTDVGNPFSLAGR